MDKLQQMAKIGKSVLIQLVGTQINFKTIDYITKIDNNICKSSNCPIYQMKNSYKTSKEKYKEIEDICCYGNCKKSIKSVPNVTYHNESNQFKIPTGNDRLSKLQVKQLILYHFYPVDKRGVVRNLSIRKIAEILNCTTKTVKANNQKLLEQEYLWLSTSDNDKFSVLLKEYKTYHLTAKQGGNGYLEISLKLFKELLQIDNVNALRLEVRKIIYFDNKNIKRKEVKPVELSYREIKRLLPDYVNYKNLIKDIISKQSKAFTTINKDDSIIFELKEEFNTDIIIKNKSLEYSNKLINLFDKENVDFEENYKQDFIQMSFQYGFDIVYEAIEDIIKDYIKEGKEVSNPGGLVRTLCISKLRFEVTA